MQQSNLVVGQRVKYVGHLEEFKDLRGVVNWVYLGDGGARVLWDDGKEAVNDACALEPVYVTDVVNKPQHYQFFPDLEAIEVIARSMTQEQFYGYCLGNRLKYRLRAGNKDKLEQDIAKSDKYLELYEQHKGKCIAAK